MIFTTCRCLGLPLCPGEANDIDDERHRSCDQGDNSQERPNDQAEHEADEGTCVAYACAEISVSHELNTTWEVDLCQLSWPRVLSPCGASTHSGPSRRQLTGCGLDASEPGIPPDRAS